MELQTKIDYSKVSDLVKSYQRKQERERPACPNTSRTIYTRTDCSCGHTFVRINSVSCKKESCPVCGQRYSALHNQKMARWLPKILWMLDQGYYIGYLIVTLPPEYWVRDKVFLRAFRRYVVRKLRRYGIKYGKVRFHWAGDKGGKYFPHLNILIATDGYLDWIEDKKDPVTDKVIKKGFKTEFAAWLKYPGTPVVHYKYKKDIGWVMHKVEYVTRPTLNLIKDDLFGDHHKKEVWNDVVKGFMNDVEIGKPQRIDKDVDYWIQKGLTGMNEQDSKLFSLNLNRCPHCHKPLKWHFCKDEREALEGSMWNKDLNNEYTELIL